VKIKIIMLVFALITALTLAACGNAIDNAISDAINNISDAITDAISDSAGDADAGGNDDINADDTDSGGSDDTNAGDTDDGGNDDTNAGDTDSGGSDDNNADDTDAGDNTPNPGDTASDIAADMVDLDDLLGEWEGYVVYRSGINVRNEDSHVRIYIEGGEYKAHIEHYSPNAGRNISFIYNKLTAELDGTILLSEVTWVNRGTDADRLSDVEWGYDGTVITILGDNYGGRYERVSAPTTTPTISVSVGDLIPFGEYSWWVLDVQDNKALIITVNSILNHRYHEGSDRNEDRTWEQSVLRSYLNGEFYNQFSADDRAKIAETIVVNNDNPWYETSGGNDTNDKIFLLSIEQAVQYFGDSGQLANRPGRAARIDDEYNEERMSNSSNTGRPYAWWLRSPGQRANYAASVDQSGRLDISGTQIGITNPGVRPALWMIID
jgi:hypothetical protein